MKYLLGKISKVQRLDGKYSKKNKNLDGYVVSFPKKKRPIIDQDLQMSLTA